MNSAERMLSCPLSDLPIKGKASRRVRKNGEIVISATHALAMLRLIEREGRVEILIQRSEIDALLAWPCRRFRWVLANGSQTSWAMAAVDLLKRGPPELKLWPPLLALAAALFAATFLALDVYFKTSIIF